MTQDEATILAIRNAARFSQTKQMFKLRQKLSLAVRLDVDSIMKAAIHAADLDAQLSALQVRCAQP